MAHIEVSVDIDEFDNDEVLEHALTIMRRRDIEKSCKREIDAIRKFLTGEENKPKQEELTIRDEQYIEVFAQLKEKFTVLELESLLSTKQ